MTSQQIHMVKYYKALIQALGYLELDFIGYTYSKNYDDRLYYEAENILKKVFPNKPEMVDYYMIYLVNIVYTQFKKKENKNV